MTSPAALASANTMSRTTPCLFIYTRLYPMRLFFLLASVFLLWLFGDSIPLPSRTEIFSRSSVRKTFNVSNCLDEDAPANRKPPQKCECSDPTEARPSDYPPWFEYHDRMVAAATTAAIDQKRQKIDVILIGDSITERWNGTRHMGERGPYPEYRAIFQEHFDQTTHPDAPLRGVALGSSGDTTNHLLWHLNHGLLPADLNPSVWFLHIGTNNMGRDHCNKRLTLSGIVSVLRRLLAARAGTPVLLHGLLPRSDRWQGNGARDFSLGHYWLNIQWINGELERICQLQDHCYYMETTSLFLETDSVTGETLINKDLMTDALHPSEKGYRAWAPLIVEQIQRLLPSTNKTSMAASSP